MIDTICLWAGRLFFVLLFIALACMVYGAIHTWVVKRYPLPTLAQLLKAENVEAWMEEKNFHNFKAIYFEMFNLPSVWWWRPCYRTWRIIRNTWFSDRYEKYVEHFKAHQK